MSPTNGNVTAFGLHFNVTVDSPRFTSRSMKSFSPLRPSHASCRDNLSTIPNHIKIKAKTGTMIENHRNIESNQQEEVMKPQDQRRIITTFRLLVSLTGVFVRMVMSSPYHMVSFVYRLLVSSISSSDESIATASTSAEQQDGDADWGFFDNVDDGDFVWRQVDKLKAINSHRMSLSRNYYHTQCRRRRVTGTKGKAQFMETLYESVEENL